MEIALNRKSSVPVREQIRTQLELRIVDGTLRGGERLPSVRALARRLKVHANTVSSAYRDLDAAGYVTLRRGSGVFVRDHGPADPRDARGLDEMIRLTLRLALRKGHTPAEIRAAVQRWMAAEPPERLVVVDPVQESGELLVAELREGLGRPVSWLSPDALAQDPRALDGALAIVLPYHLEAFRRFAPGAAVQALHLEIGGDDRRAVMALPAGSMLLVVAHSPFMLPFAEVIFRSLRGDELLVEVRAEADARAWRRLAPAADLVFADALSSRKLGGLPARRLRIVRLVPDGELERLRAALDFIVPR